MPNIILAAKTLDKINSMISLDQGASYRGWLEKVLPHLGDAYSTKPPGHRSHLGASGIGKECARSIWYDFRWMHQSKFDGRMLRLFNRGHLEEGRFIAMLLMIGCQVYQQDAKGEQFHITGAEGHFGGSGDGIAIGLPDLPENTTALCEFKTHNDKSFQELKAKGVREAKFEHYVQMNVYLLKMHIGVALYLAVNKNNDELYGEIVVLNTEVAEQFIDRGQQIVWLKEPPKKINESAGFYKCRFCDNRGICHLGEQPEVNCRTCKFSDPAENKTWVCNINSSCSKIIEADLMKTGCSSYMVREC